MRASIEYHSGEIKKTIKLLFSLWQIFFMPVLIVYGPKLDVKKKREFVEKLTDVAAEIYNMDRNTITILIHEPPAENVGVGGVLIADREG